ncbi:ABC-F family ATP-binding cassette domain-containing protein [Mucilaginibacter defluvii]|uniref:ABC-F family ATP-binding cassette domain-containing protein n=1 Tax=Mucilaginibacter defluvii TaxID=1196019 RepID=A0ABP9FVK3_9SPHI
MSIIVNSVSYSHTDRTQLFRDITFSIDKGDKAALVGNNGVGKSTLLQIVAGIIAPTTGHVSIPARPWYVPQHLGQYDEMTIARALTVDLKLAALKAITEGSVDIQHFNDLNDDWEIEDKLHLAMAEWHLEHLSPSQRLHELSGGEKTKVFLAGITLHDPDIILLDEPSNHLDTGSRDQLYRLISDSRATIVVISHDRALLNLLPLTLELSFSKAEVYGGNFNFYQAQKYLKLNALENDLHEQTKTMKQSQAQAREVAEKRQRMESRGKAEGKSGSLPRIIAGGLRSQAQGSTAKALNAQNEKLNHISDNIRQIRSQIQQYQVLKIDITSSGMHKGKVLVDAKEITYAFDRHPLWDALTFQIRSGDRVHIKGANGAGKTTLLKIVTGMLQPTDGRLERANFNYLYLDQDYTILDPEKSVFEQLQDFDSRQLQEHELRSLLIYAQFDRNAWNKRSGVLSGGEKMKLALCCLSVSDHAPDMLILDEPTNNLDIKSMEVLTAAVKDFEGTLLLISHDAYFVKEIAVDKMIELKKYDKI